MKDLLVQLREAVLSIDKEDEEGAFGELFMATSKDDFFAEIDNLVIADELALCVFDKVVKKDIQITVRRDDVNEYTLIEDTLGGNREEYNHLSLEGVIDEIDFIRDENFIVTDAQGIVVDEVCVQELNKQLSALFEEMEEDTKEEDWKVEGSIRSKDNMFNLFDNEGKQMLKDSLPLKELINRLSVLAVPYTEEN